MLTDNNNRKFETVVQVDETLVGGLNKNRHADKKHLNAQGGKGKAIVLVAVGLNSKVKTAVIPNTEIKTILPIIEKWVAAGSIMVTDEACQYHSSLDANFLHVSVNHTEGEYVRGASQATKFKTFGVPLNVAL